MSVPDSSTAARRPMPAFPEFVAMMAALMALTAMSIDIMLPALPDIAAAFGVTEANAAQRVVTDYILGFAAGQLLFGPLSDRFGRRVVLFAGLGLYAAAAFACLVADSFEMLLAARFAQGMANAAPRVIAVAIVRDVYSGRRMAEVMSFVMTVFVLVPVVAPALGGAFLLVVAWPAIFGFLLALAVALLVWMALRLPETRALAHRAPLSLFAVGRALRAAATTRPTLGYTLATGALLGALMAYIGSAEQVYTGVYGLGAWFPAVFGAVSLALASAAFVNGRLVVRLGMRRLAHGALIGFVATAALHFGIALTFGTPPLPLFTGLLALCLFFFGFLMANFNALTMEPMGRIAGTASSFVGAATTGISGLLGWAIGQQYAGSVLPLLAGFLACGALSLALVLLTERGRLFRDPAV